MNKLNEILEYNKMFVENKEYEKYKTTKYPGKKLVILSCMDTRLMELLPKALKLKNGDAKIVKNAGATIMHPFGSIIRSIIVAIYEFNTDEVLVIGHKGCGMSTIDGETTINKIVERGVSRETIETLTNSGIDIKKWLHGFDSIEHSVLESIELIKKHPLVPKDVKVHGLIMDPESRKLEVISEDY